MYDIIYHRIVCKYFSVAHFISGFTGVRLRIRHQVGLLDAGHQDLVRATRIHGNAIEYIPIALILLACAEMQPISKLLLHGFGVTLIIGRLLHVIGLQRSGGASFGRMYGTILTWCVIIGLASINLLSFFLRFK